MTTLEQEPLVETPAAPPGRKVQTIEVAVFLFLIGPSLVISLFAARQAELGSMGFVLAAASIIFRDLGLVALIVYFLWRNDEPLRRLGWKFRGRWADAALGIALFVPVFFGAAMLEQFFQQIGLSPASSTRPGFLSEKGPLEALLAGLLVMVVAFSEETIFRGYLLLRLQAATRSITAAVVLSSVVFALGHGYEGTAGLATVGVMGLVFALVYVWRGSLVAPMVMHFLQDLIGVVLVPLLSNKVNG